MNDLQKQAAKDPKTPPQELAALLEEAQKEPSLHQDIVAAIAQNPNASFETFSLAGAHAPQALLQNPALSLTLLEDPARLSKIPRATLRALFSLPEVPGWLLDFALGSQSMEVENIVACYPGLSESQLQPFIESPSTSIRRAVASHPKLSRSQLSTLAADKDLHVLQYVAAHPGATPEILENLLKAHATYYRSSYIRMSIALNPNASLETLRTLRDDEALEVRYAVMKGPATTPEVYEGFPKDKLKRALPRLLQGQNDELRAWASDISEGRALPSSSKATPKKSTLRLPPLVLIATPKPPESTKEPIGDGAPTSPPPLAREDSVEQSLIKQAKDPNTPIETVDKLLRERDDARIRAAVALHPNVTEEMLKHMARDHSVMVRKAVVACAKATPEVLAMLVTDEDDELRLELVAHPQMNAAVLKLMVRDASQDVLYALIEHPKTPALSLKILAKHSEPSIAEAAQERLEE